MDNSFHLTHQKSQPTPPILKKQPTQKNPKPTQPSLTFYRKKEPVRFSLSAKATNLIVVFSLCIKRHNPNNTIALFGVISWHTE